MSPGVAGVASASLCSDTSHELVTSLLPTLVTTTLHGGPAALGIIESAADVLTGLSKLAGGPLADNPDRRRRLAPGGYLGTAIATAAIGVTTAVWQVAILRAIAWASRGLRAPARDAMLTDLVSEGRYGRAFGLERAGDNTGAVLGPLLASVLIGLVGLRPAIWLSLIPGLLAAAAILVAARQARRIVHEPHARQALRLQLRRLAGHRLLVIMVPILCFELGNVATTLLILRMTGVLELTTTPTRAASLAIVLYALHNAVAAAAALLAGHLADRRSPRVALAAGAASYVMAYILFAVAGRAWLVAAVGFALAGLGIGLAETAESTVVAHAAPTDLRGSAFGLLGLVQAAGDLGSTVVAGLLWSLSGPAVGFGYIAGWMVLALVGTLILLRRRRTPGQPKTRANVS